jgi:formate hydrogenlyase subunit 3/multisubunit Na+/H+ antiporter MnhD subunit
MISWLLMPFALPLAMMAALSIEPLRKVVVRFLAIAPAPVLLLAPVMWHGGAAAISIAGQWTFALDRAGALMLVASSFLWIVAGACASHWLRDRPGQTRFAMWWLLTLTGSLGVFVAADIVSFYLLFAVASLPAYGLIAFNGTGSALRAARLSLAAALLGEAFLLVGFVLLVVGTPDHSLLIRDCLASLPDSPHRDAIMILVILGFGLKIGLVPLHGWMPLSYMEGTLAATAVLSGATSKAGIIGLVRFLPFDAVLHGWGIALLALGLFSAFYGAVIGLTQSNARSVLAYSSISQLGQMAAMLGAGLASGAASAALIVGFYAIYHVLVKGGLFLAIGIARGPNRPGGDQAVFLLTSFATLGFAGLPLTGGALGKLALKPLIGEAAAGLLFSIAAVGSTLLMLHFLRLFSKNITSVEDEEKLESIPAWAWPLVCVTATVIPWLLFASITDDSLAYAVSPAVIWSLVWPIALGAALWLGLSKSGLVLPRIAAGDFLNPLEGAIGDLAARLASSLSEIETKSRQWSVSSAALLAATLLLIGALALGR